MIDIADVLKEHVEQQIREGNFTCRNEGCESRAFDVRVWKDSNDVPKGAAICRECDCRNTITMSPSELREIQEPLDEFEEQIEDLQDALDDL